MKKGLSIFFFVLIVGSAYAGSVIEEVIKPDPLSGGVISEAYITEKIKDIVIAYIKKMNNIDQQTKEKYISNYNQYIIGYKLKKMNDPEGSVSIRINVNFPAVKNEVTLKDITLIIKHIENANDFRMVNAVIEDLFGKNILPTYISIDEVRWDIKSSFSTREIFERIKTLYKDDIDSSVMEEGLIQIILSRQDKP